MHGPVVVVAHAMARRNVRRSVRTKSRTDQVCGAKQRQGRAVYPALEQEGGHPLSVPLSCVRLRRAKEINQPVRPSSLFRRKKKVSVWALVLSEHLYPGSPRNEGVAHGPVSTTDPHGA